MYGLKSNAWTLYVSNLSNILSSDYNYFFHPYVSQHIAYGPSWTRRTFSQWQTPERAGQPFQNQLVHPARR